MITILRSADSWRDDDDNVGALDLPTSLDATEGSVFKTGANVIGVNVTGVSVIGLNVVLLDGSKEGANIGVLDGYSVGLKVGFWVGDVDEFREGLLDTAGLLDG